MVERPPLVRRNRRRIAAALASWSGTHFLLGSAAMRRLFALGFVYLSYVACAGSSAQPETVVGPEPRATIAPLPPTSASPTPSASAVAESPAETTAEDPAGKSK